MAHPLEEVAPARRRRWPRRLLVAANIFVALCILATGVGYGYLRMQYGRIDTTDLAGVFGRGGTTAPEEMPGEVMNVLLVGSDTRATLSPEEAESFGSARQVTGQRSDTIIVLRVDPRTKQAAMLSIPRDLYVPIAGTKRQDRINSAFQDGPEQLILTIRESLGIGINHYMQVDFNGFRGIVDAVGGVPIYVPSRARDKVSGLDIPQGGCVELDGEMALAFVRSRNYEQFESGRWRVDGSGDIGRIERQQDFVRRVVRESGRKAKGLDLVAVNRLVSTGIQNVVLDDGFSPGELAKLAYHFKSLEPAAVQMLTMPTVPATVGGASVLRMKQPDAQAVIDQFNGVTAPPETAAEAAPAISSSSVRVRVRNGSGAEGQATAVAGGLRDLGYNVAGAGDAASFRNAKSTIAYGSGQRDKALLVQSHLRAPAEVKEDPALRGVDVVLTTGGDFGGVRAPGEDPLSGPPTSAPEAPKPEPQAPPEEQC